MPRTDAEEKVLHKLGFVLGRTLGVGGFSKVKAATSTKYKVPLAIKVIDQRRVSPNFMEKFLPRELSILRKLNHLNIVWTLEIIGLSSGMVYIVMEALAADLEQQLLKQGKLPCVPSARDIFVQIVGGVHYMYDRNLVHRDLKCENVLLSADSCHARITDFGLGKEISSDLDPSSICGTVAYAPPEMRFGIPYNAKKSDIWSLGVVLFAMVTGYLPFGGCLCNMIQEQKKGVLHLKAVSLLPEPCQALIAQLLQFSPTSRPSVEQVASNSWLKGHTWGGILPREPGGTVTFWCNQMWKMWMGLDFEFWQDCVVVEKVVKPLCRGRTWACCGSGFKLW